jgi:hypothetical protein
MMSINGMISIRARLCGTGEASLILVNLVRRPSHGKSDGNVNLGNCPRPKSPLPKRARGGVIQNGAPSALRDRTASDVAASCIHLGDHYSTPRNVPRTRLVRILRLWRVQGERFRSRHRHRSGGFDRRKFLLCVLWPRWRRPLFHKLRLNVRRRRRLRDRNIFWWRRGLRRSQYCLDDLRRLGRKVNWRRFAPLRDCNRCNVDRQCNAKGGPKIPSRRWRVDQRFYVDFCHNEIIALPEPP